MMRLRACFIFVILAAFLTGSYAHAGKKDVGTTAYPFLKIGVGAKAQAMGGAFVGLADDESGNYYNPAGIIGFRQKAAAASYMNYIVDIQSGYLTFIVPQGEAGFDTAMESEEDARTADARTAFALSVNYLNYSTIEETNADGEIVGDFTGSDIAFGLTVARKVSPGLALGGTAKFIYQKVDQYSSDALAADLGLLYRFKDGRTNLGISGSNLGFQLSGLSPSHRDNKLPVMIRAGIAHRMRELPITASLEGVYPTDNDIYGALGFEIHPAIPLALRLGYSTFGSNYKTGGDKDNLAGASIGAGFRAQRFLVDYAFLPYADLGSLHRVNFAFRW